LTIFHATGDQPPKEQTLAAAVPVLDARGLVFEYPGCRALDDISFVLRSGTITALVGPNGAGKSTLMRLCAGLERPLAGRVILGAIDVHENPRVAHRNMGFLADFYGLYDDLTVRQCLTYAARAHGVGKLAADQAVAAAASRLQIMDKLGHKAGALSRGQRQRLAIAQAIIHTPHFLMLDEPASGLDPEARHSLSLVFRNLRDEGMTLMVSSHILAELQDYSSHMMVLRGGRLVDFTPLGNAGETAPPEVGRKIRITVGLAAADERLLPLLAVRPDVSSVTREVAGASFTMPEDKAMQAALLKALMEEGLPVSVFAPKSEDMTQTYLAHLQRAGREEESA